jgi:hypothetical protein
MTGERPGVGAWPPTPGYVDHSTWIGQYREMFRNTDLQVLQPVVHEGFCMGGSADSDIFKQLRRKHSEKELSTLGMTVVLKKKGRRYQ